MRIPNKTKKPRYYVAYNKNYAYSSWNSFDDALKCIRRMKSKDPKQYESVFGVIRTNESGQIKIH